MEIVTSSVLRFVSFVNENLSAFKLSLESNSSIDELEIENIVNDWLQFMWEIIVEKEICSDGEYLEYYGSGADCNDGYRVRYPNEEATHKIVVKPKNDISISDLLNGKIINSSCLDFYQFVHFDNGFYSIHVPFNSIQLEDNDENYLILKLSDVNFYKDSVTN